MLLAADTVGEVVEALSFAFGMFWEILWALILGFFLSAVVQAVVSKGEMRRLLPDDSPRSIAIACGLGAASSPAPTQPSRWPAPFSGRVPTSPPRSRSCSPRRIL